MGNPKTSAENAARILLEESPNKTKVEVALIVLKKNPDMGLKFLADVCNDPDVCRRINAVKAIGKIGSTKNIPALMRMLNSEADDVLGYDHVLVCTLITAIGEIAGKDPKKWMGRERVARELSECLESCDEGITWRTAETLGKIGHPCAVPALLKVWVNEMDSITGDSAEEALEEISVAYPEKAKTEAARALGIRKAVLVDGLKPMDLSALPLFMQQKRISRFMFIRDEVKGGFKKLSRSRNVMGRKTAKARAKQSIK